MCAHVLETWAGPFALEPSLKKAKLQYTQIGTENAQRKDIMN